MRAFALALLVAGCGDNTRAIDPMFEGLSGSRIKLQWYLYQDGTRQLETRAFYDANLHARCAPRDFGGVTRCAPLAEDSVFIDETCTTEVGQMKLIRKPTHYIGNSRVKGVLTPTRFFRAGTMTDVPERFFEHRVTDTGDECVPIARDVDVQQYFTLNGPYEIDTMIEVWPEEMSGERLGLELLTSAEGLSAPMGFHDHQLDLDCRPEVRPDGTAACVPTEATTAALFGDPLCETPVVAAPTPPRVVAVNDLDGCPSYFSAGDEHTSLVFRREGTTCVRASAPHAYRIGAPLELAPVIRTVENAPKHRLQRIRIAADSLETLDVRLFDSATRTECKSFGNGELAVCVPANAALAQRLYANDKCGREVLVAEVPRVACSKPAFAVLEETPSIHAIGVPYVGSLYVKDIFDQCRFHATPSTLEARQLGPAIPPETFVGGVVFSER